MNLRFENITPAVSDTLPDEATETAEDGAGNLCQWYPEAGIITHENESVGLVRFAQADEDDWQDLFTEYENEAEVNAREAAEDEAYERSLFHQM